MVGQPFLGDLEPNFPQLLRYMNTEEFPPRELMEYFKTPDVKKTLRTVRWGLGTRAVVNGALKKNVEDHQWISRSLKMIP